jgi:hypothetical protein
MAFILGLLFMFALPSVKFIKGDTINRGIYPVDSSPYGVPFKMWITKWFNWLGSVPLQENPANDNSGKNCAQKQSGPVWFLAGTAGGEAVRECTIPAGKAILLPVIAAEYSYKEYPTLNTEAKLRQGVGSDQDNVNSMDAIIDGTELKDLQKYRLQSSLFTINFTKNNLFGVSEGTTKAIADGTWLFLQPLKPGKHIIQFGGGHVNFLSTGVSNFATKTTYYLTIR